MQDRISQVEEASCNARPDHTLGQREQKVGAGQMGSEESKSQVEIIFFSMPTPAANARSYSSGTVAES